MSATANQWLGLAIYWSIIALMMTGLYALIARENLVKKVMGLALFQSSAILFYITMAKVRGGTAPILVEHSSAEHQTLYSNPLPHVLMLTAIVVGVATLALALALVVRIQDSYGTVEEDEIVNSDARAEMAAALRPVVGSSASRDS